MKNNMTASNIETSPTANAKQVNNIKSKLSLKSVVLL